MRDFCADLGATTENLRVSGGPGGPKPSEARALEKFAGGMTMDAIALDSDIKLSTAQYVLWSLVSLAPADLAAQTIYL